MSAQPILKAKYISPEEYIEMEIASQTKHEYFNGEVLENELKAAPHNHISGSLIGSIGLQMRGTPFHALGSNMRVKIEATEARVYPDVSVACEPRFENEKQLDLLNPRVIFEVLSPSTAAYDRSEKFRHYRQIPSLLEYILIETERPHIEHFIRQENDGWLLFDCDGLEAELRLSSIPCVLRLSEIYERVVFDEEVSSSRPVVEDLLD